jgi:hypothetical protein
VLRNLFVDNGTVENLTKWRDRIQSHCTTRSGLSSFPSRPCPEKSCKGNPTPLPSRLHDNRKPLGSLGPVLSVESVVCLSKRRLWAKRRLRLQIGYLKRPVINAKEETLSLSRCALETALVSLTHEEEHKSFTKADGMHRERECVEKSSQKWMKKSRFWEVVGFLQKICCLSERSKRLKETTAWG